MTARAVFTGNQGYSCHGDEFAELHIHDCDEPATYEVVEDVEDEGDQVTTVCTIHMNELLTLGIIDSASAGGAAR